MVKNLDGEELQKHTLNLFRGDFDRLRDFYPELDPSIVIRKLLRKHILDNEAEVEVKPKTEIKL
jgi:hypothetical protein